VTQKLKVIEEEEDQLLLSADIMTL